MKNKKIFKYLIIIFVILVMVVLGIFINDNEDVVYNQDEIVYEIVVEIKGEVMNPSIYTMPENTRISDLISVAGGFTSSADTESVNLASKLEDGMIIVINKFDSNDNKININKASVEELMTLPGIGNSKAEAIIEYRNANGFYKNIEELMNVSGISKSVFDKIKEFITI